MRLARRVPPDCSNAGPSVGAAFAADRGPPFIQPPHRIFTLREIHGGIRCPAMGGSWNPLAYGIIFSEILLEPLELPC